MSGTFKFEAGKLVITSGTRTVSTTDGNLVNLLPTTEAYNVNITYPDFTKDYAYNWWYYLDYDSLSGVYVRRNGCKSAISVIPQEWTQTTILGAAPPGADFFALKTKISRTTAPSLWGGSTIEVRLKENQWIPFTGSALLETEVGMARSVSIFISSGNLILEQRQSISVPPGGFQWYGDPGPTALAPSSIRGEEWVYGTAKGLSILTVEDRASPGSTRSGSIVSWEDDYRLGNANACSLVDPTNFTSIYNVQINGQFGRRS